VEALKAAALQAAGFPGRDPAAVPLLSLLQVQSLGFVCQKLQYTHGNRTGEEGKNMTQRPQHLHILLHRVEIDFVLLGEMPN